MAGTFARQASMMIALPPISTTAVRGFAAAIAGDQGLVFGVQREDLAVASTPELASHRRELAHQPGERPEVERKPEHGEVDVFVHDTFAFVVVVHPDDDEHGIRLRCCRDGRVDVRAVDVQQLDIGERFAQTLERRAGARRVHQRRSVVAQVGLVGQASDHREPRDGRRQRQQRRPVDAGRS